MNIRNVPEGSFTVEAFDSQTGRFAGSSVGVVTAADDGGVVNITVNAPSSGNVQGQVFAGDGVTPLNFAIVQVFDAASGNFLNSQFAFSGSFFFSNITVGAPGFRVRAFSEFDSSVFADATGLFPSFGQTVVTHVSLPIAVIKGTVTYSDATPVPFPQVFATQTNAGGSRITSFSNSNADGTYTLTGPSVGDFTITAQDFRSGLVQTVAGTVSDVSAPVVINVTMPPSGTVKGVVYDANGNPAPFGEVGMANAVQNRNTFANVDEQGNFVFAHAPLGRFTLQATDENFIEFARPRGNLVSAGDTVVVNISLPATGGVSGTVFDTDGVTPVANARLNVENLDSTGPEGFFSHRRPPHPPGTYPPPPRPPAHLPPPGA